VDFVLHVLFWDISQDVYITLFWVSEPNVCCWSLLILVHGSVVAFCPLVVIALPLVVLCSCSPSALALSEETLHVHFLSYYHILANRSPWLLFSQRAQTPACIRDPASIGDPASIYTVPICLYCSIISVYLKSHKLHVCICVSKYPSVVPGVGPLVMLYCLCQVKCALTALIICALFSVVINNWIWKQYIVSYAKKYMHGYRPVHIISRRPILWSVNECTIVWNVH